MFSGLGSISDLNQQFAQFTSNLTNLDSLQDGSAPQQASTKSANSNSDEQASTVLRSLELDNAKLTEELTCQQSLVCDLKAYLAVKDDQLHSKDSEVAYLTKELNEAIELEQTATKALAEYKRQAEEKLKALADDSADRQSPKKNVDKSSPTKQLMVANRKIAELERQLAEALNARPAELLDAQNGAGNDNSHVLELEENCRAARMAEEQVLELKNKLAATEGDHLSQTGKYSEELTSAKQYIEQLRSECLTNSESAAAQVATLQAHLTDQAGALAKLEADVQAYLTNIVELNEEKSALSDRSAIAESRCAELEASLRAAQASVSSLQQQQSTINSTNTTTSDELTQIQELADTRARLVQEAEGKVSTLTEKLKDMMHRFAELKAKSTAQTQQLEERIADITKLAQAKDSEILGLRLKMENSERSGSDTRLKVNELAERYGEAQREITRLRSVVEERVAEAVILTEQRDVGAAALLTCEAQRTDLAQRLQQLEEQAEAQLALHESGLQELKAELAAQRGAAEEEMAQLRAEVEAAQGRLRLEEDSAGNLDNYKKRAQLALKKANTANASLSAEVQQLQAALDEASGRLAESQAAAKVAMDELAAVKDALQLLRTEKKSLELTIAEAHALSSAKELEYTSRLSELQDHVSAGRVGQLQGKETDGAAVGTGATRFTHGSGEEAPGRPGPVAVAAVLPASSAAASDLLLLSASPSHQTDASPDGGSSLNGDSDSNSNNKSLGGSSSSWAIVAASESRLTSTHPSMASLAEEDGAARPGTQQHQHHQDQHATSAAVAGSSSAGNHSGEADEPSDFRATPLSSDSLLFINQLQNQLESVRKELSRRGIDLEAAHQQLQYEKDEKRVLKNRVEELLAYLERTKQLREGPDSAINMEYLKNCVFKFMSSSDLSEKRRLYPVIATILKLTSQEMRDIEVAFQATEDRENEFQNTISSIGSFAASSFGSLWGSAS